MVEQKVRNTQTPKMFAEYKGVLFVVVDAVMHPLIPYADGLTIHRWPGDSKVYLKVDDAIDWCRREMNRHNRTKYEKMIDVMEKAKQTIAKIIEQEK